MTPIPFQKALPLLLALLAPAASAQLDLPGKRPARRAEPGDVLIPPPPRRGDLAPGGTPRVLELPADGAEAPSAPLPAARETSSAAAHLVFEELARAHSLSVVPAATRRLAGLGTAVLDEARARLETQSAPELLLAARSCLTLGSGTDRAAVAERLTRPLPASVAALLFAELLASDPVVVSPEYLARLLGHDNAALRTQAHHALEDRLGPALLPHLGAALENPRTQTRLLALDLAGRCQDPAARNLLVSRLGDPSAEVASRASSLLAADPEATAALLERAFGGSGAPSDRSQAYAILALVRREEATGRTVFGPEHVPALLLGMQSSSAVAAGANAVALARVGFRAPTVDTSGWLDRDVPHWLVRYGTGAVFHSDFSTLEGPALRAFALLTGQRFHSGEEARSWWADHASGFRARRGVIEPLAGAELELLVQFGSRAGRWALVGPKVAGSSAPRELFLDEDQALRLLRRLENLGLLGLECSPTGPPQGGERFLELTLGRDRKNFSYASGSEPEWFASALAELDALTQANRWQLFHEPEVSQRTAWLERRSAFSEDLAPRERERTFKDLVLELARHAPLDERAPLVAELERLYGRVGVPDGRDLVPLLTLLEDEPRFDLGTARLLELARIAAGAAAREEPPAPGTPSAARRVLERALERFGIEAGEAAAALARDLEPEERRALARDPRPAARAAAGRALFDSLVPEERAAAIELLADPAPTVVACVLGALAECPVPEARSALAGLAAGAAPEIRALALRGLGRLGGAGAYDLALLALAEPHPALQLASVEALADLADERSVSLFSSLLVRGRTSPLHAPARRGLRLLGPAGVEECLRLAGSTSPRTRREAALFLSESLCPEALRVLLTLFSDEPTDQRLGWELVVLSGIDFRGEPDPPRAWWDWWDQVVHDDARAWFVAAAERARRPVPENTAPVDGGTLEGVRPLLALLDAPETGLVERAARELELLLGREFPRAQEAPVGPWRKDLASAVEAHFAR